MKKLLLSLMMTSLAYAGIEENLSKQLESMALPKDQVPKFMSEDKAASYKTRYNDLTFRHEVELIGANNLTPESHLRTNEWGAAYRFHFDNRWSVSVRHMEVNNELNQTGKFLLKNDSLVVDNDYATSFDDIAVSFNTIYGKFKLFSDTIVYFDQFISMGYGTANLASGNTDLYLVDLGVVFWFGRSMSSRIGLRNEFYEQQLQTGSEFISNQVAYFSVGYMFGGSK
jgi:outer membrane beta-barrel protein